MAARVRMRPGCAVDGGSTPMPGDELLAKVTPNQARFDAIEAGAREKSRYNGD